VCLQKQFGLRGSFQPDHAINSGLSLYLATASFMKDMASRWNFGSS
jgi:hypothetical protein